MFRSKEHLVLEWKKKVSPVFTPPNQAQTLLDWFELPVKSLLKCLVRCSGLATWHTILYSGAGGGGHWRFLSARCFLDFLDWIQCPSWDPAPFLGCSLGAGAGAGLRAVYDAVPLFC